MRNSIRGSVTTYVALSHFLGIVEVQGLYRPDNFDNILTIDGEEL